MRLHGSPSYCLAALLALPPAVSRGQTPAAPKVRVAAHVAHFASRGDTLEIGYVVQNLPSSPYELWAFFIDSPVTALALSAPSDRHAWSTHRSRGDEVMAIWMADASNVRPGESTPELRMKAVGVTDLVGYIALHDLTQVRDTIDAEDDAPHDMVRERGAHGTTVAIVPAPVASSPGRELRRLRRLVQWACGSAQWIPQRGICNSLQAKLEQAAAALAAGRRSGARPHLAAFLAELDAQHRGERDDHVTTSAYALLRPNVVFLLRLL